MLTLQLLAFILLGLMFFEQAGQHGRIRPGVGTTGPSLGLRELGRAAARQGGGHVAVVSRDAGAALRAWRWAIGSASLKEESGGLAGG